MVSAFSAVQNTLERSIQEGRSFLKRRDKLRTTFEINLVNVKIQTSFALGSYENQHRPPLLVYIYMIASMIQKYREEDAKYPLCYIIQSRREIEFPIISNI